MPGPRRASLDRELVRRGLAGSREQASTMIEAGAVKVRGSVAAKSTTVVTTDDPIVIAIPAPDRPWASRGAHKLLAGLSVWAQDPSPLDPAGLRCLDAGASTGGFTDVLLRAGAREVVAVDVGYGQLAWPLQQDSRVVVIDRTNVRDLTPDVIGGLVDLTVADLSFISLDRVLQALARCTREGGDLVVLVKPQFEVLRDQLSRGGVVRDPHLRAQAVLHVGASAEAMGLIPMSVVPSPLPGPAGNVEYLLRLHRGPQDPAGQPRVADSLDWPSLVTAAVAQGPQ